MPIFITILIALFMLTSLLLIGIILIQKGRGGGLASAFGGAGGHTAFGSKTGDVLTWATSVIFGIFLLLALVLNWASNSNTPANTTASQGTPTGQTTDGQVPATPPVPVEAPAAPAAPATPVTPAQ